MPRYHQLIDLWVSAETEAEANDVFTKFTGGGFDAVDVADRAGKFVTPPDLTMLTEPPDTETEDPHA